MSRVETFLKRLSFVLLVFLNILILPTSSGHLTIEPFVSSSGEDKNVRTIDHSVLTLNDRTMVSLSSVLVKGQMILSSPIDACDSIKPPPTSIISSTKTWILLTTLSSCGLPRKISNAAIAGYHVIIAKNVGANNTGRVWIPTELPSFEPSVYYVGIVGESDGNLLQKFCYPSSFTLKIEFEAGRTTIFYVLVVGGTFIAFIIAILLIKLLMSQFTHTTVNSQPVERYHQLQRAIQKRIVAVRLGQIPTYRWSQTTDTYDNFCAICLEEFDCSLQNQVRLLVCSHAFHARCIDPWLLNEKTRCPICTQNVFSKCAKLTQPSTSGFTRV